MTQVQPYSSVESGFTKPQFSCLLPDGSKPAGLKVAFLKSSTIDTDFWINGDIIILDGLFWEVYYDNAVGLGFYLQTNPIAPVIISYQWWQLNGISRRYAIIRLDQKVKDNKDAS